MPDFSFAISAGHDVASPANVESIVTDAPTVLPDQLVSYLGDVKETALSGKSRRDGTINHRWTWDYMSVSDLNTLIMTIFGNFTTASKAVTIITIDETGAYSKWNAYVDKPHRGEDYTIATGGNFVRDLVLTFTDLTSIGEFTVEFSEEFTR